MYRSKTTTSKAYYSEREAAAALGISLTRLYILLDENVFNEGTPRPCDLTFVPSDLVLLSFWHKTRPHSNVVRMPRRTC